MKYKVLLSFFLIGASLTTLAQECPANSKYDNQLGKCIGHPIYRNTCLPAYELTPRDGANMCVGPPFGCANQKGFGRVFKENDTKETVCTNAPSVSIGANGSCPIGFYHTAIARPPYNDICVSRTLQPRLLTESQKRIEFAQQQQTEEKQLEPERAIQITAVGRDSRTFRMQMRSVDTHYLDDVFHSGMGYAESLWARGFRLTVVTEGTHYWAAPPRPFRLWRCSWSIYYRADTRVSSRIEQSEISCSKRFVL